MDPPEDTHPDWRCPVCAAMERALSRSTYWSNLPKVASAWIDSLLARLKQSLRYRTELPHEHAAEPGPLHGHCKGKLGWRCRPANTS